jgi:Flp pilus assembly protein protease CpaA
VRAAEWLVIAWSLAVLATDVSFRRIPNVFIMAAILFAMAYLAFTGQAMLGGSWQSVLLGAALALTLTVPGYLARLLGAGDVKLLFAIGLLGGWKVVVICFAVAGLLGGAVALGALMLARYAGFPLAKGRWLPFGAALSIGLLVAIGLEA